MSALMLVAMLWTTVDITAVKAEPDPIRRATKAIDYAFSALQDARRQMDDAALFQTSIEAVAQGAELAADSLEEGPRKIGDWKKAEMRVRDLLRRLATLRQDAPIDDRAAVEAVEARVRVANEKLLALVMGRRK
jgi:hypothetical protein